MEKKHLVNPITITVDTRVDPSKLKQCFYDVPIYLKFSLLAHLLKKEKSGIVMVFCNTRRVVDMVSKNLGKNGIKCHAIHGGLEQNKRTRIIKQFHNNEAEILVCTNVAARGLDIKGVTHVYNYDSPQDSEEYIHRIGRTARAGEKGIAISLVSNSDYSNFNDIINNHEVKIEKRETPVVEKLVVEVKSRGRRDSSRGNSRGSSRFGGGRDSSRGNSRGFGRRNSSSDGTDRKGPRTINRGGSDNQSRRRDSSRGNSRDSSRGNSRDSSRGNRSRERRGRY